jgi:hypothetical protein
MTDRNDRHDQDLDLRTVLETSDLGLIALAEGILEGAEIPYLAKGEGIQDLFGMGRLVPVNPVSGAVEIQVTAENEPQARELLAELTSD